MTVVTLTLNPETRMQVARLLLMYSQTDTEIFDTLDTCLAERLISESDAIALAEPLGIAYTVAEAVE